MDLHETWRNIVASLDDNSPKIKIVVGVVGLIGAGVLAVVAAKKEKTEAEIEIERDHENIEKIHKGEDVAEDIVECYSDKDYAKDVMNLYWRKAKAFGKRYGVPVIVGAASTILALNGAHVLSNRLSDTTSALATITTAYSNYRRNVIDRYGEEVDREIRLGVKEEKIVQEEVVIDENGKEKKVKKSVKVNMAKYGTQLCSPYAFIVDETCTEFVPDITQMQMFADAQQTLLNQQIKRGARKWVTLSEIYDIFGRPKSEYTRDALVVGVVYDENKTDADCDNYVDFRAQRIYKMDENGRCVARLLIDPNVEGSIYEKLPKALRYSDESAM